ncbi:SUKH-4 family immunity protein [Spirillospora sp. NPDC047279]|uniref:SUKH-4 family immunity protein n=1 Tax=Spirillospora sp. NPDC047279 TaxID=3155478 RepID=UPI0034116BD9
MPTREEYLRLWGEDNTVSFPLDEWKSRQSAPAGSWPEVDLLPIDLPVAFTAYLDGEYAPFAEVVHEVENGPRTFVVLGRAPRPETSFFVLDPDTGVVHLFGSSDKALEEVNSSFAAFVRFLFRFAQFVEADDGQATRPARADVLERELRAIDAGALERAENWWNKAVIDFLRYEPA